MSHRGRDQRFYCHQCAVNVEINQEEWTCARCSSGFIEQLPARREQSSSSSGGRPRSSNEARSGSTRRQGGLGGDPHRGIFDILQQLLVQEPDREEPSRDEARRPTIRVHNIDPGTRNNQQTPFVFNPEATLAAGRSGTVVTTGLPAIIAQLMNTIGGGTISASFNPADYAWGQSGLDDIITQLLQQVEGGAPPASNDDVEKLKPEPYEGSTRDNDSQCSVCLTDFELQEEVIILPNCSHIFHPTCITNWLKLHDSCPICRTPLKQQRPEVGAGESGNNGSRSRESEIIFETEVEVDTINEPELD